MMSNSDRPILIAGPTASGKSSLACELARLTHGCVINADALQVYSCWRILTARPSDREMETVPHRLYGHVGMDEAYSVGSWLRDLKPVLDECSSRGLRPIIVGGTGLYLTALTTGLSDIPPVPLSVREEADRIFADDPWRFARDLRERDPGTVSVIDIDNPARTRRAWEVLEATGVGLSAWHASPKVPILPTDETRAFVLDAPAAWLEGRIRRRFEHMVSHGALDEIRLAIESGYDEAKPSCRILGARELVSVVDGSLSIPDAVEQAVTRTRQFAKRQRTWFRSKMSDWEHVEAGITAQELLDRS